jgi:hypothetical protein
MFDWTTSATAASFHPAKLAIMPMKPEKRHEMDQVFRYKPFAWLIVLLQSRREPNTMPRPSQRCLQDMRELPPALQRDLGLRDVDHHDHKLR